MYSEMQMKHSHEWGTFQIGSIGECDPIRDLDNQSWLMTVAK